MRGLLGEPASGSGRHWPVWGPDTEQVSATSWASCMPAPSWRYCPDSVRPLGSRAPSCGTLSASAAARRTSGLSPGLRRREVPTRPLGLTHAPEQLTARGTSLTRHSVWWRRRRGAARRGADARSGEGVRRPPVSVSPSRSSQGPVQGFLGPRSTGATDEATDHWPLAAGQPPALRPPRGWGSGSKSQRFSHRRGCPALVTSGLSGPPHCHRRRHLGRPHHQFPGAGQARNEGQARVRSRQPAAPYLCLHWLSSLAPPPDTAAPGR